MACRPDHPHPRRLASRPLPRSAGEVLSQRHEGDRQHPSRRHLPPPQHCAELRRGSSRPAAARARCADGPDGAGAALSASVDMRHQPGERSCPAASGDSLPCAVEAGRGAGPAGEARRPSRTGQCESTSAGKTPCTRTDGGRGGLRFGRGGLCLPRQRGQKPMHLFPRPRRKPRGTRHRGAFVRRRRQNPMHQDAPRPGNSAPRRRPNWQRSQNPMHQLPLLRQGR
jgi:hypothetical protein